MYGPLISSCLSLVCLARGENGNAEWRTWWSLKSFVKSALLSQWLMGSGVLDSL